MDVFLLRSPTSTFQLVPQALPEEASEAQRDVEWSISSSRVQILLLLLLVCTVNQASRALPFYLVDFSAGAEAFQAMNKDLGFTSAEYGLLATLGFTVPFSIASFAAGAAADSMDRFRLGGISCLAWSACTAGMAVATSYTGVLQGRFALGFSQAATNPAALSLIAELFPDARATASSVFNLGIYLGGGAASLGAAVDEQAGWRTACLVFGLSSAAAAFPLLLRRDPREKDTSRQAACSRPALDWSLGSLYSKMQEATAAAPEALQQIVSGTVEAVDPYPARWLLAASALRFSAGFAILVWLPSAIRTTFPNDVEQFAFLNSLIKAFAGGASSLAGGLAADTLRSRGLGDKAAAYFCCASSLAAAPLWYLTLSDGLSFETCMAFLLAEYLVAESWLGPAISALQSATPANRRGTAQGAFSSLTALGNALPACLGVLAPSELTSGLQVSVAVCYVLSGLCFLAAGASFPQDKGTGLD